MTIFSFLSFLFAYLFFSVVAWQWHRKLCFSSNIKDSIPNFVKSKVFLLLILAIVFSALIGRMIWRQHHITVAEIRANGWLPDSCYAEELKPCIPGDGAWGDICELNDDGYVYHMAAPVGKLVSASRSFFPDPGALRNGGTIEVQGLFSGKICTYDTPMSSWNWRGLF